MLPRAGILVLKSEALADGSSVKGILSHNSVLAVAVVSHDFPNTSRVPEGN